MVLWVMYVAVLWMGTKRSYSFYGTVVCVIQTTGMSVCYNRFKTCNENNLPHYLQLQ